MKRIVVGYDGSPTAEHALDRAADLAQAFQAQLTVVSVSAPEWLPVPAPVPEAVIVAAPIADSVPVAGSGTGQNGIGRAGPVEPEELAQRQLEDARMRLARRAVEVSYVAAVGRPAERLLEIAEERGADLIVVGSRAHGFLERLLGRPVDETVARRSCCDVLLVH